MYQVNHGGFTMNPQCELYKRKIYRKTEKEQQRGCLYFRCAGIVSQVRRRESADPVFFFCFFFVRKKISQKIFFDSIIKAKRVPPVFLQKSLIFFSSKREKNVEYRVRKFFQKTFRSNHKKVWNIG